MPDGGVIAGCWDYYGADHDRRLRHADDLLALTHALVGDPMLSIDPARVYLAGLSSGGGQAIVMGCLAPELYAGLGIAAGPALGTSSSQIASVSTTVEAATAACRTLAGARADALQTQLAVVVTGTADFTVAQDYADINAEMYAALHGDAALTTMPVDVAGLPGTAPTGSGTHWLDPSGDWVVQLSMHGLAHAWPAGSGEGFDLHFVAKQGLDLTAFLLPWFDEHNRRTGSPPGAGDDGSSTGEPEPDETGEPAPPDSTDDGAPPPSESSGDPAMPPLDDGASEGCGCGPSRRPSALHWPWLFVFTGLARRRSRRRLDV